MKLVIIIPIAVLAFFLGFYMQLLIKILVDILGMMHRMVYKQDTVQQQYELDKKAQQPSTTFVEPQSQAEIEADEEMERIEKLNNQ